MVTKAHFLGKEKKVKFLKINFFKNRRKSKSCTLFKKNRCKLVLIRLRQCKREQKVLLKIRFLLFLFDETGGHRVSVQGVKSLEDHFACLCWGFDCYEVKKNIIIFRKEKGNSFTLSFIFIVKSLQKEQNSTALLL